MYVIVCVYLSALIQNNVCRFVFEKWLMKKINVFNIFTKKINVTLLYEGLRVFLAVLVCLPVSFWVSLFECAIPSPGCVWFVQLVKQTQHQ